MMIERADLVERVRKSGARIIRLVAPAGYGKTTLVSMLAAHYPASAVCDCSGIADATELANRVIGALVRESPTRADSLAQQQLSLAGDAAQTLEVCKHAWAAGGSGSLFSFDNAEYLADREPAQRLLVELVAASDGGRVVAICSRTALPVHLSSVAAPHEILTLGTDDLRLRESEVRETFAGIDAGEPLVARVIEVSRGWPVAVFLLARFAREGRLEPLLQRMDDVEFDDLHEYLVSEVLDVLPTSSRDALLGFSAIPRATAQDLALALDDPAIATALEKPAAALPFITRTAENVYEVNPFVAALLRAKHARRCAELAESAAKAWIAKGDYVRAAQLYLAFGDRQAAADALERVEVPAFTVPSSGYAEVVAGLDEKTLLKHPQVWGTALAWRSGSIETGEWLREARGIWATLPADASPALRGTILGAYFSVLTKLGRVEEVERVISDYERSLAPTDKGGPALAALLRLYCDVQFRGRFADIDAVATSLHPLLTSSDFMHALFLTQLQGMVHLERGEFDAGRLVIERAIEVVMRSNLANIAIAVLGDAVCFDWIVGDDVAFAMHLAMLEQQIDPTLKRRWMFLLDCASGRGKDAKPGYERLETRAYAYLMASAHAVAGAPDDAVRFARLAMETADESSQPWLKILTHVALGELVAGERRKRLKEAVEIAAAMESAPLQAALGAVRDGAGDFGMLRAFVARFAKPGAAAREEPAHARDESGLSKREREVAALVAEGRSNREIGEALFISERTVENHIASIFNKLGIGSRAALAARFAGQPQKQTR